MFYEFLSIGLINKIYIKYVFWSIQLFSFESTLCFLNNHHKKKIVF